MGRPKGSKNKPKTLIGTSTEEQVSGINKMCLSCKKSCKELSHVVVVRCPSYEFNGNKEN